MSYRVLVVDDYMMPRTVFESVIRNSDQFTLAASLSSAQEAVTYCRNNRVDLILMDVVMMEGMNGLEASRQIKSFRPGTKIILVTSMPEVSYIQKAKEIGIESFWYKEIQEIPILELMNRTMSGESVYPDNTPTLSCGEAVSTDFTEMELEILRILIEGDSNQEIAEKMGISQRTVKMHIENMLHKTGYRNRIELAIKVRADGLIIND